jgi:hypothetical protein
MLNCVYLGLVLLTATPVWSQLTATPFETSGTSANESQMLTPPPVSGEGYPTTVGSQKRSNYLAVGLNFSSAYDDNVLTGVSTTPVSDFIYTISPTIAINKTTSRQNLVVTYIPGFTIYQRTSTLDSTGQSAAVNFQYRLNPHTTINLSDSFQKTSNAFDQLYPPSGGTISGSPQIQGVAVVAPYANQIRNSANVGFSYQLSRNGMIGASAVVTENYYPNAAEASGLYNSNSFGGSVFYSQRLSSKQYIGVTYQYSRSQSNPLNAQTGPALEPPEVQTNALLGFYTIYLNPTLSLSLSGGPQYSDVTQPPSPAFNSWTPSVTASIGWQRSHTNFVASYSRTVTGGLGLPGAYDSYSANASVRWQMARTWTVGTAGSYYSNQTVTPSVPSSNPGGQTVSGTASAQHLLSEHLNVEFGYARLHQSYSGIAVISAAPDSNREFISISYRLTRPLGR